uniref:Pr1-like protein n=1 Tax=Oryza sativa subsp. japonica TaxID=39947 RepID=Q69TD9_ORYSJ|nr:pr1-like protein [Oryza sativa Japonica Group]
MVAGGGHRHGGAAAERGEGRGKRNGRSTAHPGSTATAETATGAEEGGGAARVDEDGGVPAVGDRNGEVDEVGEVAANPKKATPKREKVRGDDGGGPELGGDGGERGATARARFRRGERAASGGNGGGRHGERLYRVGRGRERPDEGESAAEDPAAIDAPAKLGGNFPNESEGEREGKVGGKGEGIAGSDFPLFIARTDGGRRRDSRRRRR